MPIDTSNSDSAPFAPSRRRMLTSSMLAAVAGLTIPVIPGTAEAAVTDADILNFALNLEYLEAEFYLRAAFGHGLAASDVSGSGTLGSVTGGRQVHFQTQAIREYAQEIAQDEQAHVRFLRSALGGAKVARPKIDLVNAFRNLAIAAGFKTASDPAFDPFASENSFLVGAFVFEDVGVTAYKGAARLISNKDVLEAAAGILAVEAYHAGEIRLLCYERPVRQWVHDISNLRDAVDGSSDDDQPVVVDNRANIVPTDSNGLAYSRNTSQVLNIVYLGGSSGHFGFFPNRLNGSIR
jgi:hypothetical protein